MKRLRRHGDPAVWTLYQLARGQRKDHEVALGLAGALALDLARLELVTVDACGKIAAVDGALPGHELLRDAYTTIRGSSRPRKARRWVQRLPRKLKPMRRRLSRGLVQRGILAEQRTKLLGLVPRTRFPTVDPAPERELRERLRDVLLADREASEEEALLLGLLEPLGLTDSLEGSAGLRASAPRRSPNKASRATRYETRSMRCKLKPPWSSASPQQAQSS